MATAPECIVRFERERIFVASPARIGRALRERAPGSWPASPIGGGGASPHVDPKHLANFLIAQAGFVPSEAPGVLAKLVTYPLWDYVDHSTLLAPERSYIVEKSATLGRTLEIMIDLAADPTWLDALAVWHLMLCPDEPAYAMITFQLSDQPAYIARFSPRSLDWWLRERDRAQRSIEIPRQALMICGELWADSKTRLATTKDENADPLPGGPAPSTAPTAQQQDTSSSPDPTACVRAPSTTGGTHARRRRSPVHAAHGVA
jgi:hypothetical protein